MNVETGSTYDASPFLWFHFWEPVFVNTDDVSFPSDCPKEKGSFVGISKNTGHGVTFKIINSSTNKIINGSNVRIANYNTSSNLLGDPVTSPEVIKSLRQDNFEAEDATFKTSPNEEDPDSKTPTKDSSSPFLSSAPIYMVDPNDLVGRTFLMNKEGKEMFQNSHYQTPR